MIRRSVVECVLPPRVLNAVALQNAVLCAECDVISDSPGEKCLVCGSQSLFNIARVLGGKLPKQRATLVARQLGDLPSSNIVLVFPKQHRSRRRASAGPRQLLAFGDEEIDEANREAPMGGD